MTQHTWNCDACGIEINWNDESKSQPKHFGIAGDDLRIYCKDCAEKLKSAMRKQTIKGGKYEQANQFKVYKGRVVIKN